MSNPVEKGCSHLAVAEDLWPFTEGQVGGNDQRGLLVQLGYQIKEELPATLGEWQVSQFIEHD